MARPTSALLLALALAVTACGPSTPDPLDLPVQEVVVTAFQPTRWMAERLLADDVPVVCVLPEDADGAHWRPDRETLKTLQTARLVVFHGADLESWRDTANLPTSRSVDLSAGLSEHFLHQEGETHSHGMTGEHSHAGVDPHLWLDPTLAMAQVEALRVALAEHFPEHATDVGVRAAELTDELTALQAGWAAVAKELAHTCLFAAHPAYDYLAKRHGLTVTSFDLDPEGSEPDEVVETLREAGAGVGCLLLWESAPRPATAQAVMTALAVPSVVVDPGEGCQPGAEPDVLDTWRDNLTRLNDALGLELDR